MHVLYRFYNATGDLLYVGITNNPPRRLSEHRDSKDWWLDVARVDIEHYSSREQLAQAERAAIQAESPRHNIAHAAGAGGPFSVSQLPPSPYLLGEVYAFRLRDGTCPVGLVTGHDDEGWVEVSLYSWMTGFFGVGDQWIDEASVFSVLRAVKHEGHDEVVFEMDRLGDYQAEWHRLRERFDPTPGSFDDVNGTWSIWLEDMDAAR